MSRNVKRSVSNGLWSLVVGVGLCIAGGAIVATVEHVIGLFR